MPVRYTAVSVSHVPTPQSQTCSAGPGGRRTRIGSSAVLEIRCTPVSRPPCSPLASSVLSHPPNSGPYQLTSLTTDDNANLTSLGFPAASNVDPNLLNPWGISFGPTTPFWVSDNAMGARRSTPQPACHSQRAPRS